MPATAMPATWTWNTYIENLLSKEVLISSAGAGSVALKGRSALEVKKRAKKTAKKNKEKSARGSFFVLAQSPLMALGQRGWRWLVARCAGGVPTATRPTMRLVGHLALGGRKTITLVEVEGQRYLVGGGADSVTAIVAVGAEEGKKNLLPENLVAEDTPVAAATRAVEECA